MAAVLVLNTPDDGRLRPKHVEWPCRNKTCTVLHQVGVSFDKWCDVIQKEKRKGLDNCKLDETEINTALIYQFLVGSDLLHTSQ